MALFLRQKLGQDDLILRQKVAGKATVFRVFGFEEDMDEVRLIEEIILAEDFILSICCKWKCLSRRLLEYTLRSSNIPELLIIPRKEGLKVSFIEPVPPFFAFAMPR